MTESDLSLVSFCFTDETVRREVITPFPGKRCNLLHFSERVPMQPVGVQGLAYDWPQTCRCPFASQFSLRRKIAVSRGFCLRGIYVCQRIALLIRTTRTRGCRQGTLLYGQASARRRTAVLRLDRGEHAPPNSLYHHACHHTGNLLSQARS